MILHYLAWYHRTYFNLKKSFKKINFISLFINVLSFYFMFSIFNTFIVHCSGNKFITPLLDYYRVNGRIVPFYKNISEGIVIDILTQINYIGIHNNCSYLNYKIIKFEDINGLLFSPKHPFAHYQLFVNEFSRVNSDVNVTLALTTKSKNLDVSLLTEEGVIKDDLQFIFNNIILSEKKN
jgi:hypothetical protein